MAPEQLGSVPADARSDIFAFGAVLYEMVCGRAAFVGANETVLLDNLLNAEPRPLHELRPAASPLLSHVVARCLAKEPDHRWQSAQDVAASLRWIAKRARPRRLPRRAVSAADTLAIAAVALLATGAFIAWLVRRPPHQPRWFGSRSRRILDDLARDEAPEVSPDGRQLRLSLRATEQTSFRCATSTTRGQGSGGHRRGALSLLVAGQHVDRVLCRRAAEASGSRRRSPECGGRAPSTISAEAGTPTTRSSSVPRRSRAFSGSLEREVQPRD